MASSYANFVEHKKFCTSKKSSIATGLNRIFLYTDMAAVT